MAALLQKRMHTGGGRQAAAAAAATAAGAGEHPQGSSSRPNVVFKRRTCSSPSTARSDSRRRKRQGSGPVQPRCTAHGDGHHPADGFAKGCEGVSTALQGATLAVEDDRGDVEKCAAGCSYRGAGRLSAMGQIAMQFRSPTSALRALHASHRMRAS